MGATLKMCPQCHERALAPFLGPKRRCKACGAYVDVLDLLLQESSAAAQPQPVVAEQLR